jgi:hypothetical protein
MMSPFEKAERRRVTSVARELEAEGFEVIVHPDDDELPEFLRGLEPDIVAFGNEANVVVEVKSRPTLRDPASRLKELAEAVEKQPGWRLDLVVTNPPDHTIGMPIGQEPDPSEIQERIGIAREMLDDGHGEVAALIAWSAAEAALRQVARTYNVSIDRLQPEVILSQLLDDGILDDDEFDVLRRALIERDFIAHGYRANASPSSWVPPLIDATRGLLLEAAS